MPLARIVRHLPASADGKAQSRNGAGLAVVAFFFSGSKSKMLTPVVERACHWLLVHRHLW